MSMVRTVGIVGARGYVGSELIRLVARHPGLRLAFVSSRERAGQRVDAHERDYEGELSYVAHGPKEVAAAGPDAVILGLPNGQSDPYVAAIEAARHPAVILDLSADHRFDERWHYGLPELIPMRAPATRIANPGCYATAAQLALAPIVDILEGPAQCFGVSGWSGAGTSPSEKNDPDKLRDNLMPYSLTHHLHEKEVIRHLGKAIELMPHVAPHFRGLSITVNAHLDRALTLAKVRATYRERYARAALVRVRDDAPWTSRVAGRCFAEVGGFALSDDGRRLVVVSVLDNLLKGAATQAIQNLNLAFGLPELTGIISDEVVA
ncbi:MAG: N-acetyl-gamma-glutamyl-phosphate reductase [Deltaproteobacteria bacterium]|nr:N-acetyl-gamma-glutamyl-phosphate reductase [Deltaproteobacteria bacterium]